MINEHLKLLGLNHNASLSDFKKAYRRLAKENHPDRFLDEKDKKKHEIIMKKLNEAYKVIILNFKKIKSEIKVDKSKGKSKIENDYVLYKKGIDCYNIYYNSFFEIFSKREVKTLQEKETILLKAKSYFEGLLLQFPKSDWVYDSRERINKINKTIETLNKTKETYNKLNLKDSKHY